MKPKITALEISKYLGVTVQAVHKKIKALNLSVFKSLNKTYFGHNVSKAIVNPKSEIKKICVSVVKGGVGKTTITEALALNASLYGFKVLCIDVDQQANLTKSLGASDIAKTKPVMIDLVSGASESEKSIINVFDGLDLIPSRLDNVNLDGYLMLNRINPTSIFDNILGDIIKNYDLIFIDCPPTLGSVVCSSILFSDLTISPLNPDPFSYEGIVIMDKEIKNIEQQFAKKIDWRILLNKFDTRTILSSEYVEEMLKNNEYKSKVLNSVIRTSQEFSNVKSRDKTIFDSLKASTSREDILLLTQELFPVRRGSKK